MERDLKQIVTHAMEKCGVTDVEESGTHHELEMFGKCDFPNSSEFSAFVTIIQEVLNDEIFSVVVSVFDDDGGEIFCTSKENVLPQHLGETVEELFFKGRGRSPATTNS